MSRLAKRLDALEAIAEQVRLRPFRELAEERGIPLETLMRHYHQCRTRTAELRAQGRTDEQIIMATAERIGCTVDELKAKHDELRARFG